MKSLGELIRHLRLKKGLPLRTVAAYLEIDQAIMSKIERGIRKPNREQVVKLAAYFEVDEKEMVTAWLSDKLLYELGEEELALDALQMAEKKIAYRKLSFCNKEDIIQGIKHMLDLDGRVNKAWIFGSFARGDDEPESDIDILIEEDSSAKFSYFDLADIQHQLSHLLQRKIDIGFVNSLKQNLTNHIQKEAILIYEKS